MSFHPIDRDTDFLLPPSVQEWLPEAHLARYVVDVVEQLDLSAMERAYAGRGSDAYHPAMLLALLIYGYATGMLLQPQDRAGDLRLAGVSLHCLQPAPRSRHPGHLPAALRRGVRSGLCPGAAGGAGEPALALWHRQSGRHQDPRQRQPPQRAVLRARREDRSATQGRGAGAACSLAEAADSANVPDGVSLPEEIKRREDRLAAIAAAKAKIEARAAERYAPRAGRLRGEAGRARRPRQNATGKKPGGKPPQAAAVRARAPTTRSTSPTKSRASCRWPAAASSSATTPRRVVDTESMLVLATARHPGGQRQGAGRADAGEDPGAARRARTRPDNSARRHRLLQREERRGLRGAPRSNR